MVNQRPFKMVSQPLLAAPLDHIHAKTKFGKKKVNLHRPKFKHTIML